MFEFKQRVTNTYLAAFANKICELLYQKHLGDLDKAIKEGDDLFEDFEDILRNFYEIADDQVPLVAYWNLITKGKLNYFDKDEDGEYKAAIDRTIKACHEYYNNENSI